ncbi:cupin domain-containing protein [Paraburkholderia jirisanensis]
MSAGAFAQQQAITRTTLQSVALAQTGYTIETVSIVVAPHAAVARHTHPGVEMGYVIAGTGTLTVAGQPVRMIKAGDTWAIPEGTPHALSNTGDQPEQIVSTFVVQKDQPLSSAAP